MGVSDSAPRGARTSEAGLVHGHLGLHSPAIKGTVSFCEVCQCNKESNFELL